MKKKWIYLDNAATSHPKPKAVAAAMARAVEHSAGNPGRGFHKTGLAATRALFHARETISDFFGLSHPERLIFTRGATEGMNLIIKGLAPPGGRVAISRLEHNCVIRPLETMKKRKVVVEYAPCLENGTPDPERIPEVDMLITTAASNVTGALADIDTLAEAHRGRKSLLVVDASQAAGPIPMPWADKVSAWVAPGHKGLLGPQGIGIAWFAPGVEPEPLVEGGTGSASDLPVTPPFWPDRHEAGTINTPGVAGLLAGIKYIAARGAQAIREHEIALCSMVLEALGNHPRIELYPPHDPRQRGSLVSFNVKGMDCSQVAELLDRKGVAVRAGLHCSPQAHRFMGTFPGGAVRVTPGPFTTKAQIRLFISILFGIIGKP